ncbi:NUDIX hydrolase [Actinopolyspora erythraea]|uniref:ADP-ribose pyrophosphatase n=1 Tax=Actinopolyspora erythraea TaxID=414996 RepID=A0A099D2A1_9ACTN|nr:NUDIX hydrolase [Actinopolyspora erythraea]ASU77814.1 NUDIX hydrolase [Actinopolyspora erythraea]KGI80031.1 ADP-ribose pyrophosphatase [Actinopolyspora erythraea]
MRTESSRQVYANPWMTVREDAIRRADGSNGIYGVVDKPDYALIIPLETGEISGTAGVARLQLVEQYRYPLGTRRWEFPQGTAPDLAELDGLELAARELREETGLRAERLVELGSLDVAPGLSSQRGRAFLATGLTPGEHEREHEEQDMRSAWFSREALERMIRRGEVADAQSVAAYTLLLLHERAETEANQCGGA